jgi:hypothetical protein
MRSEDASSSEHSDDEEWCDDDNKANAPSISKEQMAFRKCLGQFKLQTKTLHKG